MLSRLQRRLLFYSALIVFKCHTKYRVQILEIVFDISILKIEGIRPLR
jgi:hypothetical protein